VSDAAAGSLSLPGLLLA